MTATSPYLNRPLRTEAEARRDLGMTRFALPPDDELVDPASFRAARPGYGGDALEDAWRTEVAARQREMIFHGLGNALDLIVDAETNAEDLSGGSQLPGSEACCAQARRLREAAQTYDDIAKALEECYR